MSYLEPPESKLTPLQTRACAALLAGNSIEDAAKEAGCSSVSIDRWLKISEFQSLLNAGKRACFEVASTKLSRGASRAADTLTGVLDDPDASPSVRIRAAEIILSNAVKLSELSDMQNRLTLLEVSISG